MFKKFIFLKILYPIFKKYINSMMNRFRIAQVTGIYILANGLTHVTINKSYPKDLDIVFVKQKDSIFDLKEYLGPFEECYGHGTVIASSEYQSVILLKREDIPLEVGLVARPLYSEDEEDLIPYDVERFM